MSRPRAIRWVLLIAAIAALGYLGWQRFHGEDHQVRAESGKAAPARPAVPVRTASVEKADFPVYLTGLGTVQGFNTVVVRTRVDGQINRIAFKEGDVVKEGDLLEQIDPRRYRAALYQYNAEKQQDDANSATTKSSQPRHRQ